MLSQLSKKLPSNKSAKTSQFNPPFVFTLIKKCQKYGISYDLMSTLNYHDLLYLVVDYDIDTIHEHLNTLEYKRREKQGIEIVDATNDQILMMHQN